jgi:4-amino-4-deoxychorismate lyase
MSLFFETVKIKDKKIQNLKYHNERLNKTIRKNFQIESKLDLRDFVKTNSHIPLRCKIIYDKEICSIEFFPYIKRHFKTFKIVESNIEYPFKSTNREELNALFEKRGEADDIIITKSSLLRDTSIANIALYDGKRWLTPKKPLLKGTMRQKLIDSNKLSEENLSIDDLKNSKKFAIINAIIGFYVVEKLIIS